MLWILFLFHSLSIHIFLQNTVKCCNSFWQTFVYSQTVWQFITLHQKFLKLFLLWPSLSKEYLRHSYRLILNNLKGLPVLKPLSFSLLFFIRSAFQTSWRRCWRVSAPGATSPTWATAFTPTWTRRTWAPSSKLCTNTLNRWWNRCRDDDNDWRKCTIMHYFIKN